MTIDRNWIHRTPSALGINLRLASYAVRENILEADAEAIGIDLRGDPGAGGDENAKPFSLINNTVVAAMPVHVAGNQAFDPSQQLIPQHVQIHNNLLRSPQNFGVRLYQVPAPHVARLQTAWNVSHNAYVSELFQQVLTGNDGSQQQNFPTQPTDLVLPQTPLPYNADPSDPEYLRINAAGPLAKSGTGGSLPSFIGALSPGPVSKDGDWFSRMRSRGDSISAPSQPNIAAVERRAAEWALRIGGSVKLKFADGSVRPIATMKDLPEGDFVVEEIEVFGNPRVTDADARRYLTGLSGLTSLQIHHTGITDVTLEALRNSPTLGNLHLEGTGVTDAGIKQLGTLPRLSMLMLNKTKVTADCLPLVVAQPELRGLNLGSIPASEAAARILLATPRCGRWV